MFIAMNRFKVRRGEEAAFERIWQERNIYIDRVPGFHAFHLLRGATTDEYTLFSTHTLWDDRGAFEAWTRSEAFENSHRNAGRGMSYVLGHPEFEGFDILQEVLPAEDVAA